MPSLHTEDLFHVLNVARDDLASLRGRTLLVTGATGFVGSWMVETAAFANRNADANIRVLALVPPDADVAVDAPHLSGLDGVTIVRGDIRRFDAASLHSQYRGPRGIDAIVHAAIAVDAATMDRDPTPTLETAVEGTRRTLAVAREAGTSRFLFLSSGAVYGPPPSDRDRIGETYLGGPDQTDPRSAYAEGKRIGETMCACATRVHGIETVMARGFAFVGPRLPIDRHFAIGNFIRDALKGGPVTVASDGTPIRSYQYAADMAVWLWALLVRGDPGRAYNVGGSLEISIGDLARLVASVAGPACTVEIKRDPVPGVRAERYVPDVRLATESLGLCETVGLEDGIGRTLRWHRSAS